MGQENDGPETSYEQRTHRHVQVVYARKTQQRQVYMEDLKKYRKKKDKQLMKIMVDAIGPRWYQALSVPQRNALDTLEFSIYQDTLEGRPIRTRGIIKALGIWPHPSNEDLMECVIFGRDDPKEMLAKLFHKNYGHTIDGKRGLYDLNGRLMLSGILYLGLDNLIHLLRERFRPDTPDKENKPKKKPEIQAPLASPYLQKMVAAMWDPPRPKPRLPPPLPNIDDLNEPYEEDPPLPKPPPPPPPPPPPKKRLPRSYCDKLAGVMSIEPHCSVEAVTMKAVTQTSRRKQGSKVAVEKKVYGIQSTFKKKGSFRRRRPPAPSTGLWNSQYTINGIYTVNGRTVYVLGNVTILPPCGELIHGGHRLLNGQYINIHCGFRGNPPPPKPDPCDCLKKWTDQVLQYVKMTKCFCGHRYDFKNEGTFLPDELPFFDKPTRHTPYNFNYDTIFDLNSKRLHVGKEFKRVWDTDSVLHVDDGTQQDKKKSTKKKKRSSNTCLGQNPDPKDYLKCALRLMRRVNIAARLPDIHLVPELVEWMRRRLYGPYSHQQKLQMITKSNIFWQMFTRFATHGIPHVPVPRIEQFTGHTNWIHKQDLNDEFRRFIQRYKIEMYRSHARFTNIMWPSMYQAQFPDKKFREIYFSYLFGTIEDLTLMHPYSSREVAERTTRIRRGRYICKPAGVEPPT